MFNWEISWQTILRPSLFGHSSCCCCGLAGPSWDTLCLFVCILKLILTQLLLAFTLCTPNDRRSTFLVVLAVPSVWSRLTEGAVRISPLCSEDTTLVVFIKWISLAFRVGHPIPGNKYYSRRTIVNGRMCCESEFRSPDSTRIRLIFHKSRQWNFI